MNVDISKLQNNIERIIEFNETLNYTSEQLKDTDIKNISEIKVKGYIEKITEDIYHISMNIQGNMTLTCAVSLEDIIYPLNISIDKNIEENSENYEENYEIIGNTLDIFRIVWENIVLEVPLRVVKENAACVTEGVGWKLVDENETSEQESPFAELKTILDMEENK